MTLKYCPIAAAFVEKTPDGWRRIQSIPKWAVDPSVFAPRFIEVWQAAESAICVLSQFKWLSWEQIDLFKASIDLRLIQAGFTPLNEISPPEYQFELPLDEMDALVEKGVLSRILSKDVAELEDYDAASAMWNAQTNAYDPLDRKHISVGEADSMRFRAKR